MMDDYMEIWSQYNQLSENKASKDDECAVDQDVWCKSCKKATVCEDVRNGAFVCTDCGVINEEYVMDNHAEWNFNGGDDSSKKDPSRCGCPINPLLAKSSMSTMIKSNKHHFMKRLHNQMSMDYVERSRYHVFEAITKMAGEVGHLSPAIIDQAKCYYKTLSERKLSRGVIRKGLIACCIMYACKTLNVPRSVKEIAIITKVSVPTLNKTTKIFMKTMGDILQSTEGGMDTLLESTDSKHLINRYCNVLHIGEKKKEMLLIRNVKRIDDELKREGVLDCKTPTAIITGIIVYLSKELDITMSKTNISSVFGVSIVTINKIVKMISEFYDRSEITEFANLSLS
jgi:transcription initiation factor TFIIB